MGVMPFHVRLAELWVTQRRRNLTEAELLEMTHCLMANAKYCWDIVTLQNLSLLAYQAQDMAWVQEICAQIEAIEAGQEKKKNPGSKRNAGKKDSST